MRITACERGDVHCGSSAGSLGKDSLAGAGNLDIAWTWTPARAFRESDPRRVRPGWRSNPWHPPALHVHPVLIRARSTPFPLRRPQRHCTVARQCTPLPTRLRPSSPLPPSPAHALHFAVYELAKERLGGNRAGLHPVETATAGCVATVVNDALMTPVDSVKQRCQVGGGGTRGHVPVVMCSSMRCAAAVQQGW